MKKKISIKKQVLLAILCFMSVISYAQNPTDSLPDDPAALSVYTIQDLSFGAFSQGVSGGTVLIDNNGGRSTTGNVVPFAFGVSYYAAIFEVQTPPGSIISVTNGPDATLYGSNGGTMTLTVNSISPFSTTASPPARTQVSIGGKLAVGSPVTSPPGVYTGTFYITFNQE